MRTTATNVLEAHLNILPIDLHLDIIRHRATVRLATLPPSHPIHDALREAREFTGTDHVPALSALAHRYRVNPDLLETVNVVRQHPVWIAPFNVHIAPDRDDAVVVDSIHAATDDVVVYSDGSAHDGHVGAAAYLVRKDGTARQLQLYLGRDMHYTVHAAKGAGIVLAAHLIRTETHLPRRASIGVDNQAVILGCRRYRHGRGQWAVDLFREKTAELKEVADTKLTVHWTPGHIGILGNETVDELAKSAADGPAHSSPPEDLPPELRAPIPRPSSNPSRPERNRAPPSAGDNRNNMPRRQNPALEHVPQAREPSDEKTILPAHTSPHRPIPSQPAPLVHQGRRQPGMRSVQTGRGRDRPTLPRLVPAHERARIVLRNKIGARNASNISLLLTERKFLKPLFKFVDTTGRFRDLLGTISGNALNHTIYD